MSKTKNKNSQTEQITFEQLMDKFQFHNDSVQYHAHIAQFIGEEIRTKHPEKAKETGYFTESFFENKNKAKAEGGETSPTGVSQASESAAENQDLIDEEMSYQNEDLEAMH